MGSAFAQERFTRQVSFDIAAQSVEAALLEFSKQADMQVMVGTSSLNGQKTEGVKGKLAVKDALRELLKNTGLEYRTEGNGTVTIRSAAAAKTDARVRPLVEGSRLASRDAAGEAATRDQRTVDRPAAPTMETLDEVVVTGTHLHGVDTGVSIISFSAAEIAQTGYTTVQDWVDTIPQNFAGIPNEESGGVGNFNRGTSINLRGLGTGTTLILINGRRQPASGTDGDFVDISSIPASAIERVEVLTDGASAIYGSDAIGGVVNFILRKDYSGAETKARYASASGGVAEKTASQLFGFDWSNGHALVAYQYYERSSLQYADRSFTATTDKRAFGGDDFRSPSSNPGNILSPETFAPAFAVPPAQDGTGLAPDDLLPGVVNLQNQFEVGDLLPARTMHSAFLTASQQLSNRVSLLLEGRYSQRKSKLHWQSDEQFLTVPSTNAFFVDPFGGSSSIDVLYNFVDDFGGPLTVGESETITGTIGATIDLAAGWKTDAYATLGEESLDFRYSLIDSAALAEALADSNPLTALNPFGDGSHTNPATLASLRRNQAEKSKSTIELLNVLADGPIFPVPGGIAKLAVGADYRSEDLDRGVVNPEHLGRAISSAYAELVLPLVSEMNAQKAIRDFSVSAAGRYERYSDFGSSFNPKVSLRFAPLEIFELRGTWGTSFKAPNLLDLDAQSGAQNSSGLVAIPDPQSAAGFSEVLLRFGGNSALEEQTATTWSAGANLRLGSRTSISATYYSIDYRDRIVQPGPLDTFGILFEEDLWGEIITRDPSREEADAICNEPNFRTPQDACLAVTPAAIIDFRKRNIAATEVRGIDLLLDHTLSTDVGEFALQLNGTYTLNYKTAVSDTSPLVELVDTIDNPVALRIRSTASWSYLGFGASVSLNHTGSYKDTRTMRSIEDWNTFDLRVSYQTPPGTALLDDLELSLSVTNILDELPPFVNTSLGYDVFSASALGRFTGVQVTKGWGAGR